MPLITHEPAVGYAHCAMQTVAGELAFDNVSGEPLGEDRCQGYRQTEVRAVREVIATLFGDLNGGSSDPSDQALARNVSHTHERLIWANPDDRPCPYCGSPRELTDQVRPVYAGLAGARGSADQIFLDRRQRREQGQAVAKSADAAERQADALEEANRLKARELDIRERELEATPRRRAVKAPAEVE
jgi:hypothetical protein